MAKYLKRVFGSLIEEALLIQIKVQAISGQVQAQQVYTGLYLLWKRGDTQEKCLPFGEIVGKEFSFDLSIVFNKLSIFFRNSKAD